MARKGKIGGIGVGLGGDVLVLIIDRLFPEVPDDLLRVAAVVLSLLMVACIALIVWPIGEDVPKLTTPASGIGDSPLSTAQSSSGDHSPNIRTGDYSPIAGRDVITMNYINTHPTVRSDVNIEQVFPASDSRGQGYRISVRNNGPAKAETVKVWLTKVHPPTSLFTKEWSLEWDNGGHNVPIVQGETRHLSGIRYDPLVNPTGFRVYFTVNRSLLVNLNDGESAYLTLELREDTGVKPTRIVRVWLENRKLQAELLPEGSTELENGSGRPKAGSVHVEGDVSAGDDGGGPAKIVGGDGYGGADGGPVVVGPGTYKSGDGGPNGPGGELLIRGGDAKP